MALNIHEAAAITGPLTPARRTYQNRSFVPYVYEDLPGGFCFEFDYEYEIESPEDSPLVLVTAIRMTSHDGTEYPIKVGSVCGRWLAEIESLISDEVAAECEAACASLRDGA